MARGTVTKLHPPGNNGSKSGAGKITPEGGGKDIVFQTPRDVASGTVLNEGTDVTFDLLNGKIGNINLALPPTCTLSANPGSVQPGQSTVLTWSSANATSFSIDCGVGILNAASGSVDSPPINNTTTFTLTVSNDSGKTATSSVTVNLYAGGKV